MQDEVIYSEVVFIRTEEVQQNKSNDGVTYPEVKIPKSDDRQDQHKANNAKSHTGACVHCACPAVVVLCLILLCAVAVLTVLYISHDLKLQEWRELQDQLSENQQEKRQQDLSRNLVLDSPSDCYHACPKNWELHGGKCYFFSKDLLNWTLSRDHCISIGGHLAIINSKDEQEFLRKSVRSKMMANSDRFWIGLTDEQLETQWLWVDNTHLDEKIQYWLKSEPDNRTGKWTPTGENCASMGLRLPTGSSNWHDEGCATPHKRICETISPNHR